MTNHSTIQITRHATFHRGQLRPIRSDYSATGPDGRQYTNTSLTEIKRVIKSRYPEAVVVFVETWKKER